ncbi:MAG: isoprenylcysteine carboxylmethyltransferase family protein [Altibacter sp.]|uniref:methyltransferase family protein n=1 Tax=Altibacter lentus TaxID=1223410 RepID=UPI00054DA7A7|nr:isoprenylcysteine carboxylmethyltransferase family protein [Altibacter lentus]MCW8981891.1 isoprenylcysteine carboxylmethyltransferase family protein [Altibacter sp.]
MFKKDVIYVLVQFFFFALFFIAWEDNFGIELPQWFAFVCLAFVGFGILVIVLGILNLSDSFNIFSPREKHANLISYGIYKYVRHPIYLGILISMIAYAIYSVSVIKLVISLALIVVLYLKSSYEEKLLMKDFSDYKDYKKTTGRFFPKKNDRHLQ